MRFVHTHAGAGFVAFETTTRHSTPRLYLYVFKHSRAQFVSFLVGGTRGDSRSRAGFLTTHVPPKNLLGGFAASQALEAFTLLAAQSHPAWHIDVAFNHGTQSFG